MFFNQNISDIRYCRIIIARGGLVLVANEKIVKPFFSKGNTLLPSKRNAKTLSRHV